MNTPKQRPAPRVEELEETAELPVLPDISTTLGDHDQTAVLPMTVTGFVPAARAEAVISDFRGELEGNLRGLTTSLRDLEEKLRAKSEQLSVFEREVGARDRRIAGLEQAAVRAADELRDIEQARDGLRSRVESLGDELKTASETQRRQTEAHERLQRELTGAVQAKQYAESRLQDLRGRAENFGEALQSIEARRQVYEGMVGEHELQLAEQQARIESLQRELATRIQDAQASEQSQRSLLDAERQRASGLEGELAAARASVASLEQAAREHKAASEEQQQTAAANIRSLERQLAATAHDAGAREQSQQSVLDSERERAGALEGQLSEAHTRIASLEQSARETRITSEQQQQTAATRIRELEKVLADAAHQAGLRQGELSGQLATEQGRANHLTGRLSEVEAERTALQSKLETASESVARLEIEVQDQGESLRLLQEQLLSQRNRNETQSADLAAAEERIRAAEGELRQRDARIDRLLAAESELRQQISRIDQSLEERNALINRLEGEAASSAAVLGNIQQNLERLGHESTPASPSMASATGSQPLVNDQVTRLFVRTEGETGIVHVLGRRTTIGRTPDNDMRIDAEFISRHHAVVLTSNMTTIIEDLDSTNGVYVNGNRVARRVLQEGDVVTIGRTAFRFVLKPLSDRGN